MGRRPVRLLFQDKMTQINSVDLVPSVCSAFGSGEVELCKVITDKTESWKTLKRAECYCPSSVFISPHFPPVPGRAVTAGGCSRDGGACFCSVSSKPPPSQAIFHSDPSSWSQTSGSSRPLHLNSAVVWSRSRIINQTFLQPNYFSLWVMRQLLNLLWENVTSVHLYCRTSFHVHRKLRASNE